ncbi:MAG: hypothetical protein WEA09_10150 [Gemmatimonadota bacterium]
MLQTSVPDTVVMALVRDPLATATAVAQIVVGALVVLLLLALVLLLFRIYQAGRQLNQVMDEFRDDALMHRARSIAGNLEYVSRSVRNESERMSASVAHLSGRLQQASHRMEERIEEFNALLEVIQGEAEEVFIDTASTVRGVRRGAHSLTDASPRRAARKAHTKPVSSTSEEEEGLETGDDLPPLWPSSPPQTPANPHSAD